jgi:hypothetical protein
MITRRKGQLAPLFARHAKYNEPRDFFPPKNYSWSSMLSAINSLKYLFSQNSITLHLRLCLGSGTGGSCLCNPSYCGGKNYCLKPAWANKLYLENIPQDKGLVEWLKW